MTHVEKANALFKRNFHCSQAVLAAFSEELGLTEEQALKLGACFGSGMRKGEVCGACSGALMVLGLKHGQADEQELLGCDLSVEEGIKEALAKKLFTEFYPKMVESATKIVEEIIKV